MVKLRNIALDWAEGVRLEPAQWRLLGQFSLRKPNTNTPPATPTLVPAPPPQPSISTRLRFSAATPRASPSRKRPRTHSPKQRSPNTSSSSPSVSSSFSSSSCQSSSEVKRSPLKHERLTEPDRIAAELLTRCCRLDHLRMHELGCFSVPSVRAARASLWSVGEQGALSNIVSKLDSMFDRETHKFQYVVNRILYAGMHFLCTMGCHPTSSTVRALCALVWPVYLLHPPRVFCVVLIIRFYSYRKH